jgi:BASS family bile acid:Na+ symporter
VQGFVGLSLGYWVPKLAGFTHKQRVAACFEVGVENASLSMVVARNHFSPLAAIPAVLYGKIQNLLAISVFVSRFQKMKDEEAPELAMAQAKTAAG